MMEEVKRIDKLINVDWVDWADRPMYGSDDFEQIKSIAKAHFESCEEKTYRCYVADNKGNIVFYAERVDGIVKEYWEKKNEVNK